MTTNTPDPGLIDFHSHALQYPDLADALGGRRVVIATSRASEYRLGRQTLADREGIEIGLGIHPQLAGSIYERFEREIFEAEVVRATWVSEIGLDGVLGDAVGPEFGAVADAASQSALFAWVAGLVDPGQRISVHSRGAEDEVRYVLGARGLERVIYHNFDGDPQALNDTAAAGSYFSINPWMFASERGRALCAAIPLNRILLETDGPFLVREDGRSATQVDLPAYARQLAALRSMPDDELIHVILDNQDRFLRD